MKADSINDLASRINSSEAPRGVLYLAGGGSEVLPMLLARGGGASTLLSARIPYAPADFRTVLGCDPGRLVDGRAARGLAMAAFRHALTIRGDLEPEQVFGLGASSKLSKGNREREGRTNEIHAALQTSTRTTSWSVALPRGHDRPWQERINALLLLNLIAIGKGLSESVTLEHDGRALPPESIESREAEATAPIADLLVGRQPWVALAPAADPALANPQIRMSEDSSSPKLLLPGSFRPVHAGHLAMADAATRLVGHPCGFEISLFHPEKPPLDYIAIGSRLAGFTRQNDRIYLTNAPTYIEKARLFPGCTFAVGHDTALRIVDPSYYGGEVSRDTMLDELEELGTRFLVFGRVDASGQFRDFSHEAFEHPVSGFLARVAIPVPGHIFRLDLSSTEIRERSGGEFA